MAYLTAAVIFVGLLCVLDLLLTVGVIRRLRVHTEAIDAMKMVQAPADTSLPPGSALPDFEVADVEGAALSRAGLLGADALLVFAATDCHICHEQLDDLAAHARRVPGGRDRVLAAVLGRPDMADDYRSRLGGVARVVLGEDAERLRSALRVNLFPTYVVVDEQGVVERTRFAVDQLAATDG